MRAGEGKQGKGNVSCGREDRRKQWTKKLWQGGGANGEVEEGK